MLLLEAAFFEECGFSGGGLAMCAAVGVDHFLGKVNFFAGSGRPFPGNLQRRFGAVGSGGCWSFSVGRRIQR